MAYYNTTYFYYVEILISFAERIIILATKYKLIMTLIIACKQNTIEGNFEIVLAVTQGKVTLIIFTQSLCL